MNKKMSHAFTILSIKLQQNINNFNALMTLGQQIFNSNSGIYICIYLKDPRYVYIGRTIDFIQRWNQHESQLKHNKHCGYFQTFFNEHNCTVEDFQWKILEALPINDLDMIKAHEKVWIHQYNLDPNYILLNTQKY